MMIIPVDLDDKLKTFQYSTALLELVSRRINTKTIRGSRIYQAYGRLLYTKLLSAFPEDHQGAGREPVFPGVSEQPMTYGLLLSAESLHYRWNRREESKKRIQKAVMWLLGNNDLDNDGKPGWGLPDAWDAFQDNKLNPANHPYTITTAIVLESLLEALAITEFKSSSLSTQILDTIKAVVLRWNNEVWSESDPHAGYYWYSPSRDDAFFVINVNSMMIGVQRRLLSQYESIFSASERCFIEANSDAAVKGIIQQAAFRDSAPVWPYIAVPNIFNRDRENDLIHHSHILWGLELYRSYGGGINIPWTTETALRTLDRFFLKGQFYRFPQDHALTKRPARLQGPGLALALQGRYGKNRTAGDYLSAIDRLYGPFPNLHYLPNDINFYSRQAVHVLYGLSHWLFRGSVGHR